MPQEAVTCPAVSGVVEAVPARGAVRKEAQRGREGGHEKEIIRKKWSSERAERSVRGSIRDGKTEDGRGLVKQQ